MVDPEQPKFCKIPCADRLTPCMIKLTYDWEMDMRVLVSMTNPTPSTKEEADKSYKNPWFFKIYNENEKWFHKKNKYIYLVFQFDGKVDIKIKFPVEEENKKSPSKSWQWIDIKDPAYYDEDDDLFPTAKWRKEINQSALEVSHVKNNIDWAGWYLLDREGVKQKRIATAQ